MLQDEMITPTQVFGYSAFAEREDDEGGEVYARGSHIWKTMVSLAQRDETFREFLKAQDISPDDPVSANVHQRDVCLRKIKPIVLIRDAYTGSHRRSRKNPILFFGEETIYAMCEGNPRLLAGLLNEILDIAVVSGAPNQTRRIPPSLQSRALHAASKRMRTVIRTYPLSSAIRRAESLASLIDRLGHFLHSELVQQEFQGDPSSSFTVDEDVRPEVIEEISLGLLIGAFVSVDSSEVPSSVLGSRIRLSYMLSPYYGLLFRNYRGNRLSTALRITSSIQRILWAEGNH
jgi:hypothetical protein